MRCFALLAFGLAAPAVLAVEVRTDVFIVESASLGPLGRTDPPSPSERESGHVSPARSAACEQALVGDHAIHAGSRVVIALRRYWYAPSALDADVFAKVSVEVPALSLDVPIRLDAPGVRSLFTAAGVAWYPRCFGDRALPVKGEMVLHRDGDGLRATFRIDTPVEHLNLFRAPPKSANFRLDVSAPVSKLRLEDLDAWQGGSSPSPPTPAR